MVSRKKPSEPKRIRRIINQLKKSEIRFINDSGKPFHFFSDTSFGRRPLTFHAGMNENELDRLIREKSYQTDRWIEKQNDRLRNMRARRSSERQELKTKIQQRADELIGRGVSSKRLAKEVAKKLLPQWSRYSSTNVSEKKTSLESCAHFVRKVLRSSPK